jgi:hypothetical protein
MVYYCQIRCFKQVCHGHYNIDAQHYLKLTSHTHENMHTNIENSLANHKNLSSKTQIHFSCVFWNLKTQKMKPKATSWG